MDLFNNLKKKTDQLKKGVGKTTDALLEKAAEMKNEYDESQRHKLEDWVYKKEIELKSLENTLIEREKKVSARELRMAAKGFVRFIGVTTGLSLFGIFVLLSQHGEQRLPGSGPSHFTPAAELVGNTPVPTDPYTPREKAIYSAYNDIDANDPDYDIEGYCMRKESANRGLITVDECLAAAAAKLLMEKN